MRKRLFCVLCANCGMQEPVEHLASCGQALQCISFFFVFRSGRLVQTVLSCVRRKLFSRDTAPKVRGWARQARLSTRL